MSKPLQISNNFMYQFNLLAVLCIQKITPVIYSHVIQSNSIPKKRIINWNNGTNPIWKCFWIKLNRNISTFFHRWSGERHRLYGKRVHPFHRASVGEKLQFRQSDGLTVVLSIPQPTIARIYGLSQAGQQIQHGNLSLWRVSSCHTGRVRRAGQRNSTQSTMPARTGSGSVSGLFAAQFELGNQKRQRWSMQPTSEKTQLYKFINKIFRKSKINKFFLLNLDVKLKEAFSNWKMFFLETQRTDLPYLHFAVIEVLTMIFCVIRWLSLWMETRHIGKWPCPWRTKGSTRWDLPNFFWVDYA